MGNNLSINLQKAAQQQNTAFLSKFPLSKDKFSTRILWQWIIVFAVNIVVILNYFEIFPAFSNVYYAITGRIIGGFSLCMRVCLANWTMLSRGKTSAVPILWWLLIVIFPPAAFPLLVFGRSAASNTGGGASRSGSILIMLLLIYLIYATSIPNYAKNIRISVRQVEQALMENKPSLERIGEILEHVKTPRESTRQMDKDRKIDSYQYYKNGVSCNFDIDEKGNIVTVRIYNRLIRPRGISFVLVEKIYVDTLTKYFRCIPDIRKNNNRVYYLWPIALAKGISKKLIMSVETSMSPPLYIKNLWLHNHERVTISIIIDVFDSLPEFKEILSG
ncbi:MAG: hypothetical protein LBU13_08175 [Synergistaceae bacterium]|jgi:hypothetical protein|nr:hypothetical protein [Synergistaceae bacterium]